MSRAFVLRYICRFNICSTNVRSISPALEDVAGPEETRAGVADAQVVHVWSTRAFIALSIAFFQSNPYVGKTTLESTWSEPNLTTFTFLEDEELLMCHPAFSPSKNAKDGENVMCEIVVASAILPCFVKGFCRMDSLKGCVVTCPSTQLHSFPRLWERKSSSIHTESSVHKRKIKKSDRTAFPTSFFFSFFLWKMK